MRHSESGSRPAPRAGSQTGPVLVVDFGAQYAQLIARRVRECQVYSEIVPSSMTAEQMLERRPSAIILSGGPSSVYAPGAPPAPAGLLESGVPILGICYGFQLMVRDLGGTVARTGSGEYGAAALTPTSLGADAGPRVDAGPGGGPAQAAGVLLAGLPGAQQVWMSHGDTCTEAPPGFAVTASTSGTPVAVAEDPARGLYGMQFHPEVGHTEHGMAMLRNFLAAAGCRTDWTTGTIIDDQVGRIRAQIGTGHAICGLSGGVDSAVAAALVQRAVGSQLTCVFVDHGLLRTGEAEQVEKDFVAATGVDLVVVDARAEFAEALAGVTDPERKRKIIGREFIRAFEQAARQIAGRYPDGAAPAAGPAESRERAAASFLVQGTLYPDVVESGGGTGTANIKSHHNVGGLPEDLDFTLVEPLRTLFKDEVRALGTELGLPPQIVWRQPFPGPGLAIRIVGEVTAERLRIVRDADAIAREELTAAGLDRQIWQCPVVLLADVRSVGVQGDGRSYGYPIVLRPVTSEDAMTADWARVPDAVLARISTRITNEVPEINRVVLDITSKPPGTIEWE
ncbi:MAG: glutamine-hydrolyzing GMP synthase [Streptosporangiaceae bacterium]